MKKSLVRMLMVALAVGSFSLVSAPKNAEAVSLNLMNTWQMLDHVTWNNDMGGRGYAPYGPAWAHGMFPRQGVNIGFGIGLGRGDQIVPWIGFSMTRAAYSDKFWVDEDDGYDDDPNNDIIDSGSALQFGLEIGGKFFFIERSKGKAPPFLKLSFVKYFGAIDEEVDGSGDWGDYSIDLAGYAGVLTEYAEDNHKVFDTQMLSSMGFKLAFGAEYYFNDNFCLGADLLGIEFFFASAQNPDSDAKDWRHTANHFALYSALTMTYRFSFTARVTVEFESDYDYED